MVKNQTVSCKLDNEDLSFIEELVKKTKLSKSSIIRAIIENARQKKGEVLIRI